MSTRTIPLGEALVEVSSGVGPTWDQYRVLGATRAGLALAKEPVGKVPERYKLVEPGTIFYNPMRIMIGSIAMVDEGEEPGITSPDYVVFRTRPEVLHHRWFYYWLRSNYGEDLIRSLARGAVRERLLFRRLAKGQITLPSWDTQVRIANQLRGVQIATCKSREALEAAGGLQSAYLREVFESPETQKWPLQPIGAFARLQSGYAFKSEWFSPTGIRLLRNANVHQGFVDWTDHVCLPVERRSEFRSYELNQGDIVLSLDRPVVAAGLKVARLSSADTGSLLLQRVGRFILTNTINADFLYLFLNTRMFIRSITGHDQSLGVPPVSPGQVEAVLVPLPPMDRQREVAAAVNTLLDRGTVLGISARELSEVLETLPAALLREAFDGVL